MNVFTKLVYRPIRSDWVLISIFWVMALPFIILGNESIKGWPMSVAIGGLEVVTHTSLVLVLVYSLLPRFLFTRHYWLFFVSLFVSLVVFAVLYRLGWWAVCGCHVDFDWLSVLNTLSYMARQASILAVVLTGKHFFEAQQQVLRAEKARSEAELRQLKAQIDPHFLFNNLNVLGALIQRNPDEASGYLHRFAALYRYLIRHRADDVVPLADELAFVNDYMYLIRQRFGHAYELLPTVQVGDPLAVLVSPGSIQTLVENAVKHNQGHDTDPLLIGLLITDDTITVRNELRPKLTPVDGTQTGLANLTARYQLLTDRPVTVQTEQGDFVVTLPLLKAVGKEGSLVAKPPLP
jgi:two-component system, LytTR family, sensor kinase